MSDRTAESDALEQTLRQLAARQTSAFLRSIQREVRFAALSLDPEVGDAAPQRLAQRLLADLKRSQRHFEHALSPLRLLLQDVGSRYPFEKLESVWVKSEAFCQILAQLVDHPGFQNELANLTRVTRDFENDLEQLAREFEAVEPRLREPSDDTVQRQRANLERLRRELAALPVHNPDDGFSSRDHDDELYGEPR